MKKIILFHFILLIPEFIYAQASWYQVPAAPLTPYRIDDVTFINDSTGWTVSNDTVFKTTNKGETWSALSIFNDYMRSIEFLDGQTGFIGTLDTQIGPITYEAGLFKTTDGGLTFTRIDSLLPVPPDGGICGMAHLNNLVLAVGSLFSERKVYKSTDAGLTWTLINLDSLANSLIDVYIIDNNTYIVSGQSDSLTGYKAIIIKTTDGGLTWTPLVYSSIFPDSYCWKIFMRAGGRGLASIDDAGSAAVFRTTDNGNTWSEIIFPNHPYQDLGGVGLLNDTLGWAGAQFGLGMYQTIDGGISWTPFNFGLKIDRMAAVDSVTMLAVGRTVYKYGAHTVGIANPPYLEKDAHELKIFPDPAQDKLTVELKLNSGTTTILNLFDEKGSMVKKIDHKFYPKGEHKWSIDLHGIKNGNYFLHLITKEQNFVRKFQVVHE